jgi:hypothetical protein
MYYLKLDAINSTLIWSKICVEIDEWLITAHAHIM